MPSFAERILAEVGRKGYSPLKPKALARKLGARGTTTLNIAGPSRS